MLIVISPAKTLDYESPLRKRKFTIPEHIEQSQVLIENLREKSTTGLRKLMHISSALSELNKTRFQNWQTPFSLDNARQAVFAFKGDVYLGLEAGQFDSKDLAWAQDHLRILSGLYGLLRPLDLMQPYRLEMGTNLKTRKGKDLYAFWNQQITRSLNSQLESISSRTLVNLASNEYFRSVKPAALDAEIISPVFKDWKNGDYKMISFFAKKARGSMSAWIIRNRITDSQDLNRFDLDGYRFDQASSTPHKPVFLRKQ